MASIVVSGDTSGAVTLSAPSVAGTNTITLPAATGTAMVSGNMPAFSAYLSTSNQNISTGTWTKVTLNAKDFDTNSYFDSTTNYRFQPLIAGYYQFSSCVNFQSAASGRTLSGFYKNGTIYKRGGGSAYSSQVQQQVGSALIYCNGSTDYVELYVYQDSGGTAVISASSESTYFQGVLVRSA